MNTQMKWDAMTPAWHHFHAMILCNEKGAYGQTTFYMILDWDEFRADWQNLSNSNRLLWNLSGTRFECFVSNAFLCGYRETADMMFPGSLDHFSPPYCHIQWMTACWYNGEVLPAAGLKCEFVVLCKCKFCCFHKFYFFFCRSQNYYW